MAALPDSLGSVQENSDTGLNYFIKYICILEGVKTKIKNFHWAAKNLPNNDKRGTHLYLDDLLGEVSDFQDTVAEGSSGILGFMSIDAVCGIPVPATSTADLMSYMKNQTLSFYDNMPIGSVYAGLKSETEVFIEIINKYTYLFRLTE